MDELLIGYALKALPADEMSEVERRIASNPEMAADLARLRRFLATLSADVEPVPPTGLAVDAIAAVANYIVDAKLPLEEPGDAEPAKCSYASDFHPVHGDVNLDCSFEDLPPVPRRRSFPFRRWLEISVVAGIAFLTIGLVSTGIMKIRHENQLAGCKQNLLSLFNGLSGYADTHDDQFPKVGTPSIPTAGAFITELHASGQLMSNVKATCPAGKSDNLELAAYVYTLGYRSENVLCGIGRNEAKGWSNSLTPLLADLPTSKIEWAEPPFSPHGRGQNILFADGHVSYSLIPTVNNDNIYQNQNGKVRAGLHRMDASLGRPTDVP